MHGTVICMGSVLESSENNRALRIGQKGNSPNFLPHLVE